MNNNSRDPSSQYTKHHLERTANDTSGLIDKVKIIEAKDSFREIAEELPVPRRDKTVHDAESGGFGTSSNRSELAVHSDKYIS